MTISESLVVIIFDEVFSDNKKGDAVKHLLFKNMRGR